MTFLAHTIAVILVLIFIAISFIHFYWAFGGKWAVDAVVPTTLENVKLIKPRFFESAVVGLGFLVFGIIVLVKSGLIDLSFPRWLNTYGTAIIGSIFIVRAIGEFRYVGFFKKIKSTKFGTNDSLYYSPLCLLIGVLALVWEWIL